MADVAALADRTPSRAELLTRWQAARRRRDAAPENSEPFRAAAIEIGEIELMINALDVEASEGRQVRPVRSDEVHHS